MIQTMELNFGGSVLKIETGRMAKQANGSVLATCGGVSVIATVCCSSETREELDFIPLSVEYNEKFYAVGKIPGGFIKRETRPKDKEILVSRLIDRPIRPLLHKSFKREIQIIPTTVSADQIVQPDVVAMIAVSVALSISDIPFDGPIAAVRIGLIDGEFIVNPNFEQIKKSNINIIVAGTKHGITMVEGGAKEQSEEVILNAILLAEKEIKELSIKIEEFANKHGKAKLPLVEELVLPFEKDLINDAIPLLKEVLFIKVKHERRDSIKKVVANLKEKYLEKLEENEAFLKLFQSVLENVKSDILRQSILKDQKRLDGRGLKDIRDITCEVDILQRTHGSALFTRGETQALVLTTLGTVDDEQLLNDIDGDRKSNFLLHYNFPPYSVGEVGRLSTGRREIGHGHLAYTAINNLLPSKDDFPYTIRVVSEILESNGSSSMATVCGGSLSLMAAGVPLKTSVSGIAMGLIMGENGEFSIISDILGDEDHLGDMDFKVAGTKEGITAFQLDIKIKSISFDILKKAVEQAKKGRMHILSIMDSLISEYKNKLSVYAPKIISFMIDIDKIGSVIGSGGKNIKSIDERWNTKINIENDGRISIFSSSENSALGAKKDILNIVKEPEVGTIYIAVVKKITEFGAFMEFLPGKEGLCHISKLSKRRVNKVEDVLKVGQELKVKIISIDKIGRISLVPVIPL